MMGLASGMDTDFIIQQTLKMHQFKIDNQMRNKKLIEWRQQTHNSIKDEITSLRQTFLSSLGSKSMMNRNAFNSTIANVTSSNLANVNKVSIRTNAGSPLGNFSIDKVVSLARGRHLDTVGGVSANNNGFATTARLGDMQFKNGGFEWTEGKGTIKVGDEDISVERNGDVFTFRNSNGDDIAGMVTQNGNDFTFDFDGEEYEFTFEAATGTFRGEGGEAAGRIAGGESVITINGVNITISSDDTLGNMMAKVNNSGAGVHMSYDRLKDEFTLEARNGTGGNPEESTLSLSGGGNFFQLISGKSDTVSIEAGRKAEVWINGKPEYFNTNTFDFRGVNITVNSEFEDSAVNVNLARDTDRAFNAIKDFIDSYNSIIKRLEGLLSERKTGSEAAYKPLTDEEKLGMTDKQIDEWEAIAKKGILRNDQGIQNLVSSLRSTFFQNIEGLGVSPSQIGLTTGSFFDGTGGQIMIDEEKLRGAIERDPDMVTDIFIKIDSSGSSPKGVGLLYQIDGLMREYVNVSQSTSIKNLEDSLKRTNDQISKMQERMFNEEDRLYRVFASMETAMQKLNQQGAWFNSMLGQPQ